LQEAVEIASTIDPIALERIAQELLKCQARGRVIFTIGNGGSAATASHFACDLAKGTRDGGPPTFKVLSLTDNIPVITAWANDRSYDDVFAEQLAALASPGDLLVAVSVSGTSRNVVAAAKMARSCGMTVVSLTGRTGGKLASLSDVVVKVPSSGMELVEDVHMIIAHSLCVTLRRQLAATKPSELTLVPERLVG
jgi:D-sedoheptulose 7-phosphate isomerase